ncbi:sulfatase-like hydrolase/transferase, partial [bacterium]|nr:sulfatase-like hydrolase/transferase [bacterium]
MKIPSAIVLCSLWIASATAKPPNIVFILADDQAWNGTSVPMIPGKESSKTTNFHTPNIERLAAQGVTFSQAYAAHCKCECSRASIQMGRTTTTLNAPDKRARNWSAPVTDSLVNTLKKANPAYRAAHLGKWQWFHTPASMGYDVSDGITMNETGDSTDPLDPKLSFSITRRAKEFMETQVKDEHPFFLQLSYYAVHPAPQALATTLAKYKNVEAGRRGDRAVLAAMTEDLDTCVGEILKKLDDLHIADNTLVIYTSDNGGRTGILQGGKNDLHEGGVRVPLIVRGPGIEGGVWSNEPVISYDLTATVLDFAAPGSSLPKGSEGGSWKSVLLNPSSGKVTRPIDRFVWHQATEVAHPQSAIRKGDFKLLYYWDTREAQLFEVARDLAEARNLAAEKPELAKELLDELR